MRRGPLALILLAGLLFRVVYLGQVAAFPFFDHPFGDSAVYMQRASEILSGSFLPRRPFFYGSVLYPYFLAAVRALPGGTLYLVCFIQILAGTLLAYLLARLARRLYGRAAGLAAAALTALYGPFAFLEADVLGVVFGLAALTAGTLWCVRAREAGGTRYLLLAGSAFALAATERPNLLLLLPLAALWAGWTAAGSGRPSGAGGAAEASPRRKVAHYPAAWVLLGGAIALTPAAALGRTASGEWFPLTTSFGINLYIGNHPGARGTYDEPWEAAHPQFAARYTILEEASLRMASSRVGRDLTPSEASSFWTREALSFIRSDPAAFVGLTLRKAALLWNADEVPNHLTFSEVRARAWALWLMPIGFGAVAPLAAAGAALAMLDRRRRAGTILLVVMTAGVMASLLPFFVADRYRAPMVPPLLAAAGYGCVALWRIWRRTEARMDPRLGLALVPALVLAVSAQIPLIRTDPARIHWAFAQAYREAGDLAGARAEYEAAVRESGEDSVLLNNLAQVYRALGMKAEAEEALRRAVHFSPDLAYPHKNLGILLIGKGALDEGLLELEEAVRLEPRDPEALGALAALQADRGEEAAAAAAYRKARRLDPGDPRLARLLERYPYLGAGEVTAPPATP